MKARNRPTQRQSANHTASPLSDDPGRCRQMFRRFTHDAAGITFRVLTVPLNAVRQTLHWVVISVVICGFRIGDARAEFVGIDGVLDGAVREFRGTFFGGGFRLNFKGANELTVLGWEFRPQQSIDATALGWIGHWHREPHEVGIFNSRGDLLVSVFLETERTEPEDSRTRVFRWVEIPALRLESQETYVVAGVDYPTNPIEFTSSAPNNVGTDEIWRQPLGNEFGPGIDFLGERRGALLEFVPGGGDLAPLIFPTSRQEYPADFPWFLDLGPNFRYEIVPEPSASSLTLMLLLFLRQSNISRSNRNPYRHSLTVKEGHYAPAHMEFRASGRP